MFKPATQLDPTKPEPGLYVGVSRANYFATAACNHSLLQEIRKSPAHVAAAREVKKPTSESMRLGTAFHIYCFERAMDKTAFERQVKVIQAETTKTGKPARGEKGDKESAKLHYEAAFPEIAAAINADDMEAIVSMSKNINAHPDARRWRSLAGHCEVMLVWNDPAGVVCKARFDKIIPSDSGLWYWLDAKSTRSVQIEDFEDSIRDYFYHTQNAFYRRGWAAAKLPEARSVIVAVENQPPHAVATFSIDDETQAIADGIVNAWLIEWAECEKSGKWPRRVADAPTPIGLPGWVKKRYKEFAL
jgi:hypothetical protein